MINEAFWVFYLAGLSDNLAVVVAVASIALAASHFVSLLYTETEYYGEERQQRMAVIRSSALVYAKWCVVAIVFVVLFPSKDAIYAGAAQSVVEYTQVDDTLLLLKEKVDEKLAEKGE